MIYMRECANKEGDLRYPNVDMCSSYVDSHHHHECHCVWIFDLFDFWEIVWYCVELFWEESVYEVIVWTVDNLLIYINIYQSHLTHICEIFGVFPILHPPPIWSCVQVYLCQPMLIWYINECMTSIMNLSVNVSIELQLNVIITIPINCW